MSLLLRSRLGFGLAFVLSVSPASAGLSYPACNRKPTAGGVAAAKAAHMAALSAYNRGDYDEAIRRWSEAYSADCTADNVLLNLANAYLKKGDNQAALTALTTYVQRAGTSPTIAAQIQSLQQRIASSSSPQTTAHASGYPACDRVPTPEDRKRAQAMLKAAAEAYYGGDYEKAIKFLRAAYAADCTAHSVLVNIGRAYEKKGDKQGALTAYQTYLQRAGPDQAIEEKVKGLTGAQKSTSAPSAGARP
jgi:tetratricopeptide (TPR) repeat protein